MKKLLPSRPNRTRHEHVMCEPLEPRALLAALAIADYFPLKNGATWNYAGTLDGHPMTAIASVAAGPVKSGAPAMQLATVFQPSAGGTPTTDTRFYANTQTGLRLRHDDISQPSLTSIFDYAGAGARLVKPTFNIGDVIHFASKFSGSTAVDRLFTGRFVGDVVINGIEVIDTSAGSFEAVKISLAGSFTEDGSTGWTGAGTVTETRWLVRGVGTARVDYAQSIVYSDQPTSTFRFNMGLTQADSLGELVGAQVTGKGVVIALGDSSPGAADGTNFAGVDVNGGTKTRIFKIRNTSGDTITLAPGTQGFISISGANAGDFTVIRQPSRIIQPGQTTLFSVRFDPAAAGFSFSTVSFATDDSVDRSFAFDVRGTGIYIGAINVFGGAGHAIVDGAMTTRVADGTRFGSVAAAGDVSVTKTFVISNSGVGTLTLTGTPRVSIAGADSSQFFVATDPAGSVSPGGTTSFTVTFDPSAVGAQTALVSIASNDRFNSLFTFLISGTGV
jgi:hypothetical protein